ncbi:MAG TPA: PIN domain-containing protein [Gammaproteobacteria bacterium]|nr:PIN domain-containing protein [Gammaproteobacteria bacterium]
MILLDTNVVLDVLQKREPHYNASAAILDRAIRNEERAALAAHAVTTIHYIVARYRDGKSAHGAVNWLLRNLQIAAVGHEEIVRAQALGWSDFEDAVVAAVAEAAGCDAIVTRNVKDFAASSIPAVTPEEYVLDWLPGH